MTRLDGKIAIITGAARGTGEETARLFVECGARALLTDVLDERGAKLAAQLGANAAYQRLDVREPAQWASAVAETKRRFGAPNVLVNNAAILTVAAIDETPPERAREIFDVNLLGPLLGIQAVLPELRTNGGGSIVNVASIDALEGEVGVAAYGASKWGLRGLTKCAGLELAHLGIRVNTVCPAGGGKEMSAPWYAKLAEEIRSGKRKVDLSGNPKQPLGRELTLREIALAIAWLASDESSFCNAMDLAVDGGFTAGHIFPGAPRPEK
jgi:3alpha(or 20beta)-hydroxysteroid dehydrogenase